MGDGATKAGEAINPFLDTLAKLKAAPKSEPEADHEC